MSLNGVASHELALSETSDYASGEEGGAARPQPPAPQHPQQPRAARRGRGTDPAAALAGQTVAAARRRVRQNLPRTTAVAAAAACATGAASSVHSGSCDARATSAAVAARSGGSERGGTIPALGVLLVVLLGAAAAAVLRLGPAAVALTHGSLARARTNTLRDGVSASQAGAGGWAQPAARASAAPYSGGAAASAATGLQYRTVPYVPASAAAAAASAMGALGWLRPGRASLAPSAQSPPLPVGPATRGAAAGGGALRSVAAGAGGGGGGDAEPAVRADGTPYEWREGTTLRVITIVPEAAASPYRTTWGELASHTAQRLEWTDPGYQMLVFDAGELGASEGVQRAFLSALSGGGGGGGGGGASGGGGAHMVVGLEVAGEGVEAFLRDPRVAPRLPPTVLLAGGAPALAAQLTRLQGGLRPQDPASWRTALARRLPWTPDGGGLAVWDTLQQLLGRRDSDNFLFVYLVLANAYVTRVPQVADTTKGFDLQSLVCMFKNCGDKVIGCVRDPTCKGALDCLNACSFNDQVCQYRCIVSAESPLLEAFSLCILQLHNCRNLAAQPPRLPDPAPMAAFRGASLTHEAAEEMFIGWLDARGGERGGPRGALMAEGQEGLPFSWLVAGGKNPAYDYFPCQHQLFYRGKGRGQMWYEPVFKAITLDGREVWRRRVYRVRRGKVPGTFHLSVLDNGVTSNEFWRIVDCDEGLAWCLFYYSGAASTAGLSYSGAVLGTPDGAMPPPQHTARLHAALARGGIQPWELSTVDNSRCADAPLGITGPVGLAAAAAAA